MERGKAAYLEIYANLQQGKTYFFNYNKRKEGVQQYLDFRKRDVELGHIVRGRLATIATHLQHWLGLIGKDTKLKDTKLKDTKLKDTKLKDLERTDGENYFYHHFLCNHKMFKAVRNQITLFPLSRLDS